MLHYKSGFNLLLPYFNHWKVLFIHRIVFINTCTFFIYAQKHIHTVYTYYDPHMYEHKTNNMYHIICIISFLSVYTLFSHTTINVKIMAFSLYYSRCILRTFENLTLNRKFFVWFYHKAILNIDFIAHAELLFLLRRRYLV